MKACVSMPWWNPTHNLPKNKRIVIKMAVTCGTKSNLSLQQRKKSSYAVMT